MLHLSARCKNLSSSVDVDSVSCCHFYISLVSVINSHDRFVSSFVTFFGGDEFESRSDFFSSTRVKVSIFFAPDFSFVACFKKTEFKFLPHFRKNGPLWQVLKFAEVQRPFSQPALRAIALRLGDPNVIGSYT